MTETMTTLNEAEQQRIKNYVADLKPSLAGRFLYRCLPYRKKVIFENFQQVFGHTLSAKEMATLAKSFYGHLAKSVKENLLLRFQSIDSVKARVDVIGKEKALAAAAKNKGILLLAGHFGNWEYAPIGGILNFEQYRGRFHIIRKLIGTKSIEKVLFSRYYRAGLEVIPKKNSLNKVCDALEQQDAVVFVMDQYACVANKDGISVEFFGKPAGTYRSPASIVRYTGVPVLPISSYRKKDGRHVLQFHDPIPWVEADDAKQELYENTLAYNKMMERFVLEHPEQWLWTHRRWKPN